MSSVSAFLALPAIFSPIAFSSSISTIGKPAFFNLSFKSCLFGFTAIPLSVTSTSTVLPGVVIVCTLSTTIGSLALNNGATIIHSFDSAAVSLCPPEPPIMYPLESVCTFTLKLVSISVAPKITMSKFLITDDFESGFA